MRAFLVVMDDSREAEMALRYAARHAADEGATVALLALIPQQEFVQWGGVQAAMEEEARLRAEAMALQAASAIVEEAGIQPKVLVREGDPAKAVATILAERNDIVALVLGAAEGSPGPLISHFASAGMASLTCPLIIVPGALDPARLGGEKGGDPANPAEAPQS